MGTAVGGDSSTPVPQNWCTALAPPTHPTNPSEQSSKPGPTKAQSKTKPGYSTSQTPQRKSVQSSTTQSAVPLLTIDVDRLQLPILFHFHPLPTVLNNPGDRQTNRWTVKGTVVHSQCTPAGSCRVGGLMMERSLWQQGGLALPSPLGGDTPAVNKCGGGGNRAEAQSCICTRAEG